MCITGRVGGYDAVLVGSMQDVCILCTATTATVAIAVDWCAVGVFVSLWCSSMRVCGMMSIPWCFRDGRVLCFVAYFIWIPIKILSTIDTRERIRVTSMRGNLGFLQRLLTTGYQTKHTTKHTHTSTHKYKHTPSHARMDYEQKHFSTSCLQQTSMQRSWCVRCAVICNSKCKVLRITNERYHVDEGRGIDQKNLDWWV